MINAFGHKCSLASCQYKANLGQRPSWVPMANLRAIEKGLVSITINPMVIEKSFSHHTILVAKQLTTKNFQWFYVW
jgi:hypothetical protein